jgi:hypothetical protein
LRYVHTLPKHQLIHTDLIQTPRCYVTTLEEDDPLKKAGIGRKIEFSVSNY